MRSPGPDQRHSYVFGRFRLSADGTLLLRDGAPVSLAPKVLQTLLVLVERAGEVVSKADLLQAVWPDSVVEETGLTRNISLLRQALGDEGSALITTVPRIGYRFTAPVRPVDTPPGSRSADAPPLPREADPGGREAARTQVPGRLAWLVVRSGLAVALLGAVAALSTGWLRRSSRPPLRVRPITSAPGPEWCPALSPDGTFVAYSDQKDIYVKPTDGGEPLRVAQAETAGGAAAVPTWSPDGRQIAYFRHHQTEKGEVIGEVFVVPALGGPARKLTSRSPGIDPGLCWSPDRRFLAYPDRRSAAEPAAIVLYSLETGERRRITNPTGGQGDSLPRFAPDGRTLAFARAHFLVDTDLYVVALDGGEERRLTEGSFFIRGLDWAPDGQSIVFSSWRKGGAGRSSLWRARLSGGAPELLEFGEEGQWPSVSLRGNRLAYMRHGLTRDIWRVGGPTASSEERSPRRLVSSSQYDGHPHYSPDGAQIGFASGRSGALEIWVCSSDGSSPRQLTFLDAVMTARPMWSPDGKQIAFGSLERRNFEVFVVSASEGVPRRLTDEGGGFPTAWSRDGRWVYFSSTRSGRRELWKVPSEGGEAVQVTRHGGGLTARESSDGRLLFFSKKHPWEEGRGGLWRMPVDGGEEVLVLDQVASSSWAFVGDGAVLHVDRLSSPHRLRLFDLPTGEVTWSRTLDVLSYSDPPSVSPDGRFVLYTGVDRVETDVMLVEDFQ